MSSRLTRADDCERLNRMKRIIMTLACLGATSCSLPSITGMATTLSPGQRVDISTVDGKGVATIHNDGPGEVTVEQEKGLNRTITLQTNALDELAMAHPASVVNRSPLPALVVIRIRGTEGASIQGPPNEGK